MHTIREICKWMLNILIPAKLHFCVCSPLNNAPNQAYSIICILNYIAWSLALTCTFTRRLNKLGPSYVSTIIFRFVVKKLFWQIFLDNHFALGPEQFLQYLTQMAIYIQPGDRETAHSDDATIELTKVHQLVRPFTISFTRMISELMFASSWCHLCLHRSLLCQSLAQSELI